AGRAIKKQSRSLLASGVIEIEGKFQRGDIVTIYDHKGSIIGCGISNYSSNDINAIRGSHSKEIVTLLGYNYGSEVVHRNNMVVL
ncbi:PUA domain-containing protein, partial [Chloroflexota bacterium]